MGESLRRFTNVLALLDIIKKRRLTLLNPTRWYDRNDALGLEMYSKLKGVGSVYAMCFAIGREQAHHWQLFSGTDHGVCIRFDRDELAAHLDGLNSPVLHRPIQYRNLKQIASQTPIDLDTLPFLKRDTFEAECEYRIVAWEDEIFAGPTYSIPLPPRLVKQVIMGPTMPRSAAEMLRDLAREDPEWKDVRFSISYLVNNNSWAEAIETAVKRARLVKSG